MASGVSLCDSSRRVCFDDSPGPSSPRTVTARGAQGVRAASCLTVGSLPPSLKKVTPFAGEHGACAPGGVTCGPGVTPTGPLSCTSVTAACRQLLLGPHPAVPPDGSGDLMERKWDLRWHLLSLPVGNGRAQERARRLPACPMVDTAELIPAEAASPAVTRGDSTHLVTARAGAAAVVGMDQLGTTDGLDATLPPSDVIWCLVTLLLRTRRTWGALLCPRASPRPR